MVLHLNALRIDAVAPYALAGFWAGLLGWEVEGSPDDDVVTAVPTGTAAALRFVRTDEPKSGRNRMHLDLTTLSGIDQERMVHLTSALGGGPYDVGQTGDEPHVVLADPEGNEFCVVEPGSQFLAGCGTVGALNCEGNRVTGVFWSEALRWPLVWDQDGETAVQSPAGGAKVTWSGPPLMDRPASGRNRWRFELQADEGTRDAEAERLVGIGARVVDATPDASGGLLLADPDDNEFHLR